EKKARGNVHIALGDNIFYGGQTRSAVHMDMVLYEPTVTIDDRAVVVGGEIRLP
ncbi:MAG: leucyl aminopeptidase, partial [Chloroflexi bacterium]